MKKHQFKGDIAIVFLLLIAITFVCIAVTNKYPNHGLSGHSITKRVGPDDIYPNHVTTPGAINLEITQANIKDTICNPHWSTKSIRPSSSYTNSVKKMQLEYEIDQNPKDYEEDHFISLELGGASKDVLNLWPEPYQTSIANGGAKSKDAVENYLHKQVCNGSITLQEAQDKITADWYKVYAELRMASKLGAQNTLNYSDPDDN